MYNQSTEQFEHVIQYHKETAEICRASMKHLIELSEIKKFLMQNNNLIFIV